MPNQYTPGTPIAERFWSKVDKSGDCWIWRGTVGDPGYGVFSIVPERGKRLNVRAHRLAFELTHGCILPGCVICHRCDNRLCVNPAHLFVGAPMDNSRDMVRKGRQSRLGRSSPGTQNGRAKLTDDDIETIRRRYADGGVTQREIARDYGLPTARISSIVTRKTWRHIA